MSARGEESDVLLAVQNQGPPIPSSALPTIFDPFVRAPEGATKHRRGVGLGLYIARQIVVAHGGTIVVTSDETTGTVFTARLPRHNTAGFRAAADSEGVRVLGKIVPAA